MCVCNGHYSTPRLPPYVAQPFPGIQLHAHNYRTSASPMFQGRRVVVVGAAASGSDIALEIAEHAAAVYVCARRWENPKLTWEGEGAKPFGPGGRVRRMPNVASLGADGSVHLEGGSVIEHVDVVMYCTGYQYDFPFLETLSELRVVDNVRALALCVWFCAL